MVPITDNYQIYCNNSYGPDFGFNDIYISDSCGTNKNSYTDFPITYNIEGPNKYKKDQAAYTAMSGATANYNFKVIEY